MEPFGLSQAPVAATVGRDMPLSACFADSRLDSLVLGRDLTVFRTNFYFRKFLKFFGWNLRGPPGTSGDLRGPPGTSGDLRGPPGTSGDLRGHKPKPPGTSGEIGQNRPKPPGTSGGIHPKREGNHPLPATSRQHPEFRKT